MRAMNEPRDVTPDEDWRKRESPRRGVDNGTVVWGLILIVVGGWFFLDQTLGFRMPDLDWSAIWPIGLIVIGGAVILQGLGRRRT
jgi:hypothetical protein